MKTGFFVGTEIWYDLLNESDYDFYHLPGYLQIEQQLIGGEPIFFYYENQYSKAVIPLLKRQITNTEYFDLISPYGYPGILVNRTFEYKKYNDVLEQLCRNSNEEKIVSVFLRLNPILNNYLFLESENIKQEIHGRTVFVPLRTTYDTLLAQYSTNHKRNIKKLKKEGYYFEINNWNDYERWQKLYIDTMSRLQASNYYFFDKVYFHKLFDLLGDKLILLSVYDKKGILAAGGLFTNFNGIIQYHLGGTKNEYLPFAPTKIMFDEIIRFGIDNNSTLLHLGGGLGGEVDSLFTFKSGFSKNTMHFSTIRMIANLNVYKQFVHDHFNNKPEVNVNELDYFPLYRY